MSSEEGSKSSSSEESELEFDTKDPICAMSKGLAKMLYAVDGEVREQMCAEILDYANVMYENYRQLRDNEFFVSDVVEGGKEDGEAVPVAAGVDPAPAVDEEEIDAFIDELMQGPAPAAVDPPEAGEPVCYGPQTFLEYKYGNDVDNDKKVQNRMRRTFWQNIYTNGKDEDDNVKRHCIGEFYKNGDEEYKWEMVKSYHNVSNVSGKAAWRTFVSVAGASQPAA